MYVVFLKKKTQPYGHAEFLNPNYCIQPRAITHPRMPHSPSFYPTVKIDADPFNWKIHPAKKIMQG
jgi:hypothetical protein